MPRVGNALICVLSFVLHERYGIGATIYQQRHIGRSFQQAIQVLNIARVHVPEPLEIYAVRKLFEQVGFVSNFISIVICMLVISV